MKFKTTKVCSGYYRVTNLATGKACIIDNIEKSEGMEWSGWVAREDKMTPNTDGPFRTKAEAVASAHHMLGA